MKITQPQIQLNPLLVLFALSSTLLSAQVAPINIAKAIPWDQIGAKAGVDYKGKAPTMTEQGARLRCVFQRLEAEATREGLWLAATVTNQNQDRFRVTAAAIGAKALPAIGDVMMDGHTVRFSRPGLVEEYSVSSDGIRQDFVVSGSPSGTGALVVKLAVSGARAEQTRYGAKLVLTGCGREIAYGRLKVTDVTGTELNARLDVAAAHELTITVEDTKAIYPIRIDPTFSDANWVSINSSIPGADGAVSAAVMDDSGNLYIGGGFIVVGGVVANFIAKWDGSNWSSVGSGLNDGVRALAVSGNDLYVGGYFTRATNSGGSAVTVNRIAKWDGSNWSALGSGMNYAVLALAASSNGLYAGGVFTTAGGTTVNQIAKWNGSNWSALGSGVNSTVYALAASGSDLYAGGIFTTAADAGGPAITVNRIAKWNGSGWSPLGSGVNDIVNTVAVSGSDLYAGGWFTTAGGVPVNYLAKWDGSGWSSLGSGVDYIVEAVAVSGGDLYAGGEFTTAGAATADRIAKWNGSSWSALDSGMNRAVLALAVSGVSVYAGGEFTMAGGTPASFISKWNLTNWLALGSGMNAAVQALATSGSNLYLGGRFTTAGNAVANYVAKWDGSNWSALGEGLDGWVLALALSGTNLYAGGAFTRATNSGGSAVTVNRIAKWNGSNWSALGSGMNYAVHALAASSNDLYAGGDFTTSGGTTLNRIAKWDGSNWSALGQGMNGMVLALAVSGSDLYAGGSFTRATNSGGGAITVNRIVKWNGSNWLALGLGMDQPVMSLAVSGSDLYAGGGYLFVSSPVWDGKVAKWEGSAWSALGLKVNGSVQALAVCGGRLYAGGDFTQATNNGGSVVTVNGIAEWNGNSWSALGSGMNYSAVYVLAGAGSGLYAGGAFTTAGGKMSAYVAKWAPLAFGGNSVTITNGALQALLTGPDTNSVVVDGTTTFSNWTPVATNILPRGGALQLSLPISTNPHQFYRARLGP
jgi:hypothetical protein